MTPMDNLPSLEIFLYDEQIGTIVQLPGDKNLFIINSTYAEHYSESVLSLSLRDRWGDLLVDTRPARTRLPPFFSNLLPEGALRDYLALQVEANPIREFYLLQELGDDLPGAITVRLADEHRKSMSQVEKRSKSAFPQRQQRGLHFSLAGVQLKFSAIWEQGKRLTIPVDGVGGSWIVKLPSLVYPGVPENEYTMMNLARQMGLDVPDVALLPLEHVAGLPPPFQKSDVMAYAIRRFDRDAQSRKIHIEDFAQVFGVYPEKKYDAASYRNIAEVLWAETGERGIVEFIRRFVFNALIGNGDMHLKNWSLIYLDKKTPTLAPAYDFLSTLPYLPQEELALNFVDSKTFASLTLDQFRRFAVKSRLPETLVLDTVQNTVRQFKQLWPSVETYPLAASAIQTIEIHFKSLPIWRERE
ncbi:MAG: type II toxin-antitoxin system HipA family toxin [Chlamydiia bacterium]|nr:type II toxin-antitoxin system HipA family toxin [Chlamydiia bacterium]